MQLAGDGSRHDFQLLAPTGTTVFLREVARRLSGGKARGFTHNKMSTYRWPRVSNLSFLARCPRISSVSLEREQRSPLHECLQEDSQEHRSKGGGEVQIFQVIYVQGEKCATNLLCGLGFL